MGAPSLVRNLSISSKCLRAQENIILNISPPAVLLHINGSIRGTIMGKETNPEIRVDRLTRRMAIAGVAMALGGVGLNLTAALAESADDVSRTAEAIHQTATFKASRKRVYKALTDTRQFDKVIELSG